MTIKAFNKRAMHRSEAGNMLVMLPLLMAIGAATMYLTDSFKGSRMMSQNNQRGIEGSIVASDLYDLFIEPNLKSRGVVTGRESLDNCPEISTFKNLHDEPSPYNLEWSAGTIPDTICGASLQQIKTTLESAMVSIHRESKDIENLSSVVSVSVSVVLKPVNKGQPSARYTLNKRLNMRAPRYSDFSLIIKSSLEPIKERIQIEPSITKLSIKGSAFINNKANGYGLDYITSQALDVSTPPRIQFDRVMTDGTIGFKPSESNPVFDMSSFYRIFPRSLLQAYLERVYPLYRDPTNADTPGTSYGAFGVAFDVSQRRHNAATYPLVKWDNYTSQSFSDANSNLLHHLPVLSSPVRSWGFRLEDTCHVNPGNFDSTIAPLVFNAARDTDMVIDFQVDSGQPRFCGLISTKKLTVKIVDNGKPTYLIGTFLAESLVVEGKGELVIVSPKALSADDFVRMGFNSSPSALQSHFSRVSQTYGNPYHRPLFSWLDIEGFLNIAARVQFKPMRPLETDATGHPLGYYRPCGGALPVNVLCPRDQPTGLYAPTTILYSEMNATEWLNIYNELEPIL